MMIAREKEGYEEMTEGTFEVLRGMRKDSGKCEEMEEERESNLYITCALHLSVAVKSTFVTYLINLDFHGEF